MEEDEDDEEEDEEEEKVEADAGGGTSQAPGWLAAEGLVDVAEPLVVVIVEETIFVLIGRVVVAVVVGVGGGVG